MTKTKSIGNIRFRAGSLVEFDCPHFPETHGRQARIIGVAGFNGPDWWELELFNEFVVMPDPEHVGGQVLVRQSFAPDAILKPITHIRAARSEPVGDSFYLVDSHGFIFGPAMTFDHAKQRASFRNHVEIIPAGILAEKVAGARELSASAEENTADLMTTAQAFSSAQQPAAPKTARESEHA